MKHKILMTLVALFTMMAGAWADETVFEYADPMVGTLTQGTTGTSATTVTINSKSVNAIRFGNTYKYADGKYITIAPTSGSFKKGDVVSIAGCISNGNTEGYAKAGIYTADGATRLYETANVVNAQLSTDAPVVETYTLTQDAEKLLIARSTGTTALYITTLKVMRTPAAPEGPKVTWDAATKTGTFEMPAYDVEIAPIYAPAAKWATEGNLVLTPTAIEGVYAESTDAIVKAGTVAKTGDNVQGTAMYFATTDAEMTAEKAAAAEGWLSTLPTAAGYDGATTVYVWYYIKGADTPQGQDPSAENTFNDLEICATPLKVEVLSNKFDIQFNAANANTIESGKATVKVGETAAEVKEGKLTGVKMGSKVTITAKEGYKFRKAEGKKGKVEVFTVEGQPFYFIMGENWQQAIESHPTENANWIIDGNRAKNKNGQTVCYEDSGDPVELTSEINPKTQYTLRWGF